MYPQDNDDDFADFEAGLKSLHPRAPSPDFVDRATVEPVLRSLSPGAPSEDFADRVITEGRLLDLAPRSPSEGFADRVVAASVSVPSARILRFPRALVPFAAAAALALAFAPSLMRRADPVATVAELTVPAVPAPVESAPKAPVEVAAVSPEHEMPLPVIDLPDGRSYRPKLRTEYSAESYRAMPGGVVVPVSFPVSSSVEYEPVVFY